MTASSTATTPIASAVAVRKSPIRNGSACPSPPQRGHGAADGTAQDRAAAAGERAVVRQCLRERHRDARADRGGEPDQERRPARPGGERGGEQRRERRYRWRTQPIRRARSGVSAVGGTRRMTKHLDRREFIQLAGLTTAGIAGVVFSSGLRGVSYAAAKGNAEDFMFLQMSDLHWGFTGPAVNPDAEVTLDKAIAHVNALPRPPDFIAFTGDLTHTTDDPQERRKRLPHVRHPAP